MVQADAVRCFCCDHIAGNKIIALALQTGKHGKKLIFAVDLKTVNFILEQIAQHINTFDNGRKPHHSGFSRIGLKQTDQTHHIITGNIDINNRDMGRLLNQTSGAPPGEHKIISVILIMLLKNFQAFIHIPDKKIGRNIRLLPKDFRHCFHEAFVRQNSKNFHKTAPV